MDLLWKSVTAILFAFTVQGIQNLARGSPCAEVQVDEPVVVLGSSLNASCRLLDGCPLTEGRSVLVEWHLNGRFLAGLPPLANESGRISRVTVPNFSDPTGSLTCCVRQETGCQIVGGKEIRGGYPPSAPQSLACQTNLTKPFTLTCKWDPVTDTHLPTNYTLHTEIRQSKTETKHRTYLLPDGQHVCIIPRVDFHLFAEMRIQVTAQNALGTASSEPLFLDPMESAKLDPPAVVDVGVEQRRFGCLRLVWRLSEHQLWLLEPLAVEVRFRTQGSDAWATEPRRIPRFSQQEALEQCGLLHATEYEFQMRVRCGQGPWSDWGPSRTGCTLEKAPTGRLNVWLKVLREQSQTHDAVQLFWKPSEQFRANGRNVWYHVYVNGPPGKGRQETVCRVQGLHCQAVLRRGTRRVYITAQNSAGESSPTPVIVYQQRALEPVSDISVSSKDDNSLQVSWTRPLSSVVTGYVMEWGPLLETDPLHLSFSMLGQNKTSAVISAGIEPYKPYWISVYSRYRDGIGYPRSVEAYSRQKAPSVAPSLKVEKIHSTYALLTWQDVPLEHRHGIIQSYTLFCWDEGGRAQVVQVKPTERRVVLGNLSPMSMYKLFIMASTEAGNVNGSILTLNTAKAGAWDDVIIVVPACIVIAFTLMLTAFVCCSRNEGLKMRFWPMIPDPANSSIKTWTQADKVPDYPAFQSVKDIQDPSPVHLSWFSLLDVPEKRSEKGKGPNLDDLWLQDDDPKGLCEPVMGTSDLADTCEPGNESPRETVPYATVVFACPYLSQAQSQSQPSSPVYLRSDSTQPLLGEESPSPKTYQNFHFSGGSGHGVRDQEHVHGQSEGESSAFWEEFPLLSALNLSDAHSHA
ncbi:hypothetical protein JZ751_008461 [Albula glossodonta]|uniref:Colony stimulating factor 3 receptor n=1 Tax=Albula glossodonta TaxID=121402 RepID=A0A8T2N279_9TELE|nr:hypothetical protein JZ751_008461 [Albula glossodonta]